MSEDDMQQASAGENSRPETDGDAAEQPPTPPANGFAFPTEELIEAAREGDLAAWDRLDERYRETISLFMRGRVPSAARRRFDTEDMMQSALLSAFTQLDSFEYRGPGSFGRWVRRLVLNRMNGRLREQFAAKRDVRRDENIEALDERPPSGMDMETPSQKCSQVETSARLLQAIAELPRQERDVIKMVVFDRQSVAHIAEQLEISTRQVRRCRIRALDSIRRSAFDSQPNP